MTTAEAEPITEPPPPPEPEGRPLSQHVIATILNRHRHVCPIDTLWPNGQVDLSAAGIAERQHARRFAPGRPAWHPIYSPTTGERVSSLEESPEARTNSGRFVVLSTRHMPDPDDLTALRIMPDGSVK